jgi:hypothetical protein
MATVSGNIIRVAARQIMNDVDEVTNVFHFTVQTAGAGGDAGILGEVSEKLAQAWVFIDQELHTSIEPLILDVFNVSQDYPLGSTQWGSDYNGGTNGGSPLPNQDALLVLWYTATKRVQGKTYIGGLHEGTLDAGLFNGGAVTAVATWANVMLDPTPANDDVELLLGVWSVAATEMRPIVSTRVSSNPATQRSRRRGRGS